MFTNAELPSFLPSFMFRIRASELPRDVDESLLELREAALFL
jgi:hypothetical protein